MEPEPDQGLRTPDSELEDSASPRPQPLAPSMPLLIEIGCEEIPARFLSEAQKRFGERLLAALEEAHLVARQPGIGSVGAVPDRSGQVAEPPLQTYSTPRRLVVYVPEVLANQPDQEEEILGPPLKLAFDAAGKPTRAAESFAAKNRAGLEDLVRVTTPKGEYVALKKTTPGRTAHEVLPEILPAVIAGLSFPKSMYWVAKSGPRFVRPIRWLLALLGEGDHARVIPFEIAGVHPGNATYGHRNLVAGPVSVSGFMDYSKRLPEMGVEFDPERRRERVRRESKALLQDWGLTVVKDKELEDWIVNSTEWPRALVGSFEQRFLKLPREILITVMRDHQKYFAVEDGQGNLQPRFVAVSNLHGDPKGLIRSGHERVLTARFADAEFFWNADQKILLRDRLPLLEKVTYQEKLGKLGSYADKVKRMTAIARAICGQLRMGDLEREHALRAVQLSKCDLTTQMVREFPELQGIMGGLYAREQAEPKEVAEAIYDHYLPASLDDRCPRTLIGAIVSLADKLDSVVGGFAVVGHAPAGSSDPFALRRMGNGIIKLVLESDPSLAVKLETLVRLSSLSPDLEHIPSMHPVNLQNAVLKFLLKERMEHYLEASGKHNIRYDTQRAVIATGWTGPLDVLKRCLALEKVRDTGHFEALTMAAKRIKNILSKSATAADWNPGEVEPALLKEEPEVELFRAYEATKKKTEFFGKDGDYHMALESMATLRPPVDRFFDKVLVMAEDRALRQNRLRLLAKLDELFSSIADLSQIESTTSDVVGASTRELQHGVGDSGLGKKNPPT